MQWSCLGIRPSTLLSTWTGFQPIGDTPLLWSFSSWYRATNSYHITKLFLWSGQGMTPFQNTTHVSLEFEWVFLSQQVHNVKWTEQKPTLCSMAFLSFCSAIKGLFILYWFSWHLNEFSPFLAFMNALQSRMTAEGISSRDVDDDVSSGCSMPLQWDSPIYIQCCVRQVLYS